MPCPSAQQANLPTCFPYYMFNAERQAEIFESVFWFDKEMEPELEKL